MRSVLNLKSLIAIIFWQVGFAAVPARASDSDFHGAALGALEAEALRTYPAILAAESSLEAAGYGIESAEWAFYPTPQVGGRANDDGSLSVTLKLIQPLWTGGRLDAGKDQARARSRAAYFSVANRRLSVSLTVVELYASLISDLMVSDIYLSGLGALTGLRAMIKRRTESHVSSLSDFALADTRYAALENDFFMAQSRLSEEYARLSEMVGRKVALGDMGSDFEAGNWRPRRTERERLIKRALMFNPDIARLRAELDVARGSVRLRESSYFPTLSLNVEHDLNQDRNGESGRQQSDSSIYLTLESTLSPGLGSMSEVKAARSSAKAARHDLLAAESALRQRLEQLIAEYRSLDGQVDRLSGNVRRLERILDSYKRLFLLGRRSWLDLLNMVREGIQAREALVRARVRLFMLRETLKRYEIRERADG